MLREMPGYIFNSIKLAGWAKYKKPPDQFRGFHKK
jgi:hypothetical protein